MSMTRWYYSKDRKSKNGPITRAELGELARTGRLLPTDMVNPEDGPKWFPAAEVEGLFQQKGASVSQSVPVAAAQQPPARPQGVRTRPSKSAATTQNPPSAAKSSARSSGLTRGRGWNLGVKAGVAVLVLLVVVVSGLGLLLGLGGSGRQTTDPLAEGELVAPPSPSKPVEPPSTPPPPPPPPVDPTKGRVEVAPPAAKAPAVRRPLHELFKSLAPAVPLVEAEGVGSGSGFLVKHEGKYLVVTNRHVIENANKGVIVHFLQGDGKEPEKRTTIPAKKTKVIAVHRSADLAVLDLGDAKDQIESLRIEPVQLAPANHRPQVGEHAFAIGHPGGESLGLLTRTLSDGIISAVGRKVEKATFLQVTVPVNPGNSGGPLFDDDGRVVGVNTFIIRKSSGRGFALEALNFALESSFVHEALTDSGKSLTSKQIAAVLNHDIVEVTPELTAALKVQAGPGRPQPRFANLPSLPDKGQTITLAIHIVN